MFPILKISPLGNLLWRTPLARMSFHILHLRRSQFWEHQLECHCRLQCRSVSCPFCGPHRPSQFLKQVPKCTEVSGKFICEDTVRLKVCQVSMLLSGPDFLLLLLFFFSFQTMWLCFQVYPRSERATVIEAVWHVSLSCACLHTVCTITIGGVHEDTPSSRSWEFTSQVWKPVFFTCSCLHRVDQKSMLLWMVHTSNRP